MSLRSPRTRLFLAAAVTALAAVGACNINPQPLPPESLSGPGGSDNSSGQGGFGSDAAAAPPAVADSGKSDGDGGLGGQPDGGAEGGRDAGGDAATDGSSDASRDALEDG